MGQPAYEQHGLSLEQYEELRASQNHACAICLRTFKETLHVDHDHRHCRGKYGCTECVRGLLCSRCNRGIGFLNEKPEQLRRAADYLQTRSHAAKQWGATAVWKS